MGDTLGKQEQAEDEVGKEAGKLRRVKEHSGAWFHCVARRKEQRWAEMAAGNKNRSGRVCAVCWRTAVRGLE